MNPVCNILKYFLVFVCYSSEWDPKQKSDGNFIQKIQPENTITFPNTDRAFGLKSKEEKYKCSRFQIAKEKANQYPSASENFQAYLYCFRQRMESVPGFKGQNGLYILQPWWYNLPLFVWILGSSPFLMPDWTSFISIICLLL